MRWTKIGIVASPQAVGEYFDALAEMPAVMLTDVAFTQRPGRALVAGPGARTFIDGEALIDGCSAEVVIIAAAVKNADLAARALKRGRHVILVSPWHVAPGQFAQLVDLARRRGKLLLFSQPAAWAADIVVASRAIVLKGQRPFAMRGTLVARDAVTVAELMEQALALSRMVLGAPPETISAAGGVHYASMSLFHASGQAAHFQLSAGETKRERTVTLLSEQHSWRLDLDQPRRMVSGDTAGRVVPLQRVESSPLRTPLGLELVHLLRALKREEQPVLSHTEVGDIVLAVEAAKRSLLGMGAPIQTAAIQPVKDVVRPQLRSIKGGGHGAPDVARPILTVVS